MRNKISWSLMTLLCLLTVLIVSRYWTLNPEVFFPEQRGVYLAHLTALLFHISGGMIALTIGPFLFVNRWRSRWPALHRWLGRLYFLGVLCGGMAGLYLAGFAYGGEVSRIGFAMLALFWLASGLMAFVGIRDGDVTEHRRWIVRNFALSLGAAVLRLQMPILGQFFDFEIAYRIVAWTAWVPNLLVAEWLVRRSLPKLAHIPPRPFLSFGR